MGSDNLYKKRRQRNDYRRKTAMRETKDTFLIVCEGTKTEPYYFEGFKLKSAEVKVIGEGCTPHRLVQQAILHGKKESYDQVWVVFDRDDHPKSDINNAFQLAENNHIQVAYSNEAFELWYLLHFQYMVAKLTRHDYIERLSEKLGVKYRKNIKDMYERLLERQRTAIRNAEKLIDFHHTSSNFNRIDSKPHTTIHHLVHELNRFM